MRRNTRRFVVVLGVALVLGILTVAAQIRPQNQRIPTRPPRDPRVTSTERPRVSEDGEAPNPTVRGGAAAQMPQQAPQGATRVAAVSLRDVRDWSNWATGAQRDGDLRLRRVQEDTLLRGRYHERLDQYYKGVPVFGGDIARQTDGRGTLSIFGTVYGGIDLDVTPTLTAEDAVGIFEAEVGQAAGPLLSPELMILPKDDGTFVLTYRMTQFTGHELPVVFINAQSGAIEWRYDNLQKQQAAVGRGRGVLGDEKKMSCSFQSGSYYAIDRLRPSMIVTFNLKGNLYKAVHSETPSYPLLPLVLSDVAVDPDNYWTDSAVVDAHTYIGWTYDYFYKRFGRRGLDGADKRTMYALIHSAAREDVSWAQYDYWDYYVNAWFCPQCGLYGEDTLMFGEGLPSGYYVVKTGQYVDYKAASIDTVAHEYTHGVTTYSSHLTYWAESGALAEGFSDSMAVGTEFYFQLPGSGSQRADYLLGEDSVRPSRPGSLSGSRSLADPTQYSSGNTYYRDHYSKRYVGSDDSGGVHHNSTIVGNAFYLAIEGGANRTSGLSVQGVGAANREQIEKVFYRAFAYYLTSTANFSAARAATIRSAQELYGVGGPVDRAVTQAWNAVGVY